MSESESRDVARCARTPFYILARDTGSVRHDYLIDQSATERPTRALGHAYWARAVTLGRARAYGVRHHSPTIKVGAPVDTLHNLLRSLLNRSQLQLSLSHHHRIHVFHIPPTTMQSWQQAIPTIGHHQLAPRSPKAEAYQTYQGQRSGTIPNALLERRPGDIENNPAQWGYWICIGTFNRIGGRRRQID